MNHKNHVLSLLDGSPLVTGTKEFPESFETVTALVITHMSHDSLGAVESHILARLRLEGGKAGARHRHGQRIGCTLAGSTFSGCVGRRDQVGKSLEDFTCTDGK